ncbi:MAG: hypothetical protein R3272_14265 [Candidatus Promineifilaceae bacterium]|nr:hypothetical protein [Candidatus Promineifilaceae bacterium]
MIRAIVIAVVIVVVVGVGATIVLLSGDDAAVESTICRPEEAAVEGAIGCASRVEAQVEHGPGEADLVALAADERVTLLPQDLIQVSEGGEALLDLVALQLRLFNDSALEVQPVAEGPVLRYFFFLLQGGVLGELDPDGDRQALLETPGGETITVLGTTFWVVYADGETMVGNYNGEVVIDPGAGADVDLTPGHYWRSGSNRQRILPWSPAEFRQRIRQGGPVEIREGILAYEAALAAEEGDEPQEEEERLEPGAVSGIVWHDLCTVAYDVEGHILAASDGCVEDDGFARADGHLDDDEPGLEGVDVWLLGAPCREALAQEENEPVAVTETDARGQYSLDPVPPGRYCIVIPEPPTIAGQRWEGEWTTENWGAGLESVAILPDERLEGVDFGWDPYSLPDPATLSPPIFLQSGEVVSATIREEETHGYYFYGVGGESVRLRLVRLPRQIVERVPDLLLAQPELDLTEDFNRDDLFLGDDLVDSRLLIEEFALPEADTAIAPIVPPELTLQALQQLPAVITLQDEAGEDIASAPLQEGQALLEGRLPEDGRYTLDVSGLSGRYALTLQPLAPGRAETQVSWQRSSEWDLALDRPAAYEAFDFTVVERLDLVVFVLPAQGLQPMLELFNEDGKLVGVGEWDGELARLLLADAEQGTYRLLISAQDGRQTGWLELGVGARAIVE